MQNWGRPMKEASFAVYSRAAMANFFILVKIASQARHIFGLGEWSALRSRSTAKFFILVQMASQARQIFGLRRMKGPSFAVYAKAGWGNHPGRARTTNSYEKVRTP